jgi:hypothetical protein
MSIDSMKKDEPNPLDDKDKLISDTTANKNDGCDANKSIFDQENVDQGNIPINISTSHDDKSFGSSHEKKVIENNSKENEEAINKQKSYEKRKARAKMLNAYNNNYREGISEVKKVKNRSN